MRYFLDTEFNGFFGELIALALVPEDEGLPAFYAALACPRPTPWVAEHVLPVLDIEPVTREAFGHALAAYLGNDPDPLLFADWPEDIAHAAMMLVAGPGRRHAIDRVRFELCDAPGFDSVLSSVVPHHPRHDAAALRAFILAKEARSRDPLAT